MPSNSKKELAMDQVHAPKDDQSVIAAQAKIWNYIYGYTDAMVLKCANELDIATILHNNGEPMTLSELASKVIAPDHDQPVNKDRLHRVLRYMVHMNLFTVTSKMKHGEEEDQDDHEKRYGLAPAGRFLVKGWDTCMVPILLSATDDRINHWLPVEGGLFGETTAFEKARGKSVWEFMAEHPEMNQNFNELMASHTKLLMPVLVSECDAMFREIGSLVDVGGGTGTALRYISKAFPHIKCTLYDLPHVIEDAPSNLPFDLEGGDMFNYIPSADAILLKCVLHDWDDEECIKILEQCKKAVGDREGGKVIIVDIVLDDHNESNHPLTKTRMQMDLAMMLYNGSKERSEKEWKELIIKDAGFSRYKVTQISALQSVIEAYP